MELHSGAKVEDVGERVGRLPAFREIAADVHLVVAFDEAAEYEAVDAFGEGVGANARVEIGRHGFDQERDAGGVAGGRGWAGACGEENGSGDKRQGYSAREGACAGMGRGAGHSATGISVAAHSKFCRGLRDESRR